MSTVGNANSVVVQRRINVIAISAQAKDACVSAFDLPRFAFVAKALPVAVHAAIAMKNERETRLCTLPTRIVKSPLLYLSVNQQKVNSFTVTYAMQYLGMAFHA